MLGLYLLQFKVKVISLLEEWKELLELGASHVRLALKTVKNSKLANGITVRIKSYNLYGSSYISPKKYGLYY